MATEAARVDQEGTAEEEEEEEEDNMLLLESQLEQKQQVFEIDIIYICSTQSKAMELYILFSY